jgi:uncharacterized protein YciI
MMAYYVALLHMLNKEKNQEVRPQHIKYLDQLDEKGNIFARGPFTDESGGLVVYIADSYDEALSLAKSDPHIIFGSRHLELKEWEVYKGLE